MTSQGDEDSINTNCSSSSPLHILVIPLMAQGHMVPMLDLARLLASRRVLTTFVTTPANLARIRPIVDEASASSLPIRFVALPFPVARFGIPDGCENTDLLPSLDLILPLLNALPLLHAPLMAYLRAPDPDNWPPPACIIADNLHHWAADVARSFRIPRLIFHGTSCFFLFCSDIINRRKAELAAALASASDGQISLPELPHSIQVGKHQVVPVWDFIPGWTKFLETVKEVEKTADGVLVNSFAELEPWYLEAYHEAAGKPVWPIGPVSLYQEKPDVKVARGRASPVDRELLCQWLDAKETGSVIYVSFGSTPWLPMAQIMELGYGLEASQRPFVWVVKAAAEWAGSGMEEWLSEFERRVQGRGMVIREWAPQALILGHAAVGGFLTHCGWNSTLEAVAAGVVMVTLPLYWDQFLNRSFVMDVLKTGVAVYFDEPVAAVEAEEASGRGVESEAWSGRGEVMVWKEEVERVVERLMGGGEEGKRRRERARELSEKAKRAMEEGGSSWDGLQKVITFALVEREKNQGLI